MSAEHLPPDVAYVVNASDVLAHVNEAWSAFAIANGAPHLVAEHVLGRSLWDFIADDTTRHLYRALMRHVRNGARSTFAYRCDSPEWRRYMRMTMSQRTNRQIAFESVTLRVAPAVTRRPGVAPSRAITEPIQLCGWCMRALTDNRWIDLDTAVSTMGLFAHACAPGLTHGVCPSCFEKVIGSMELEG